MRARERESEGADNGASRPFLSVSRLGPTVNPRIGIVFLL